MMSFIAHLSMANVIMRLHSLLKQTHYPLLDILQHQLILDIMAQQGNLSSLKSPPPGMPGFDPKATPVWLPKEEEFESLRDSWISEWNKVYGYRQ